MTPTPPFVVELGTRGPTPLPSPIDHHRGQLYHLTDLDAVVVREHRQAGGWRCQIVARRHPTLGAGRIDVTDDDLAAAATTVLVNPTDQDGFAMVWLAQIMQYCQGGHRLLAAYALANDIRCSGTLTVDVDEAAAPRLMSVTRLRTYGSRLLLSRFVDAGFLDATLPGLDGSWGIYTLTLPETGHLPLSQAGEKSA
jgi:hypothetical protein